MAHIRSKLSALLGRSQYSIRITKAIVGSSVGLSIATALHSQPARATSCDTNDDRDMASALQAILNRMVANEVNRQIKLISESETQCIRSKAVDAVHDELAGVLPAAVTKAKQSVVDRAREMDLSDVVRKARDDVQRTGERANDKAWWTIKKCLESELTQERLEAELKKVISNDPSIQRIIGEHLATVRVEVRQAAEQILQEESFLVSSREKRYDKANKVPLSALQEKGESALDHNGKKTAANLEEADRDAHRSMKRIQKAVDSRVQHGLERANFNARVGQVLSGAAILGILTLIGGPYVGISLKK